jgi:hypothetical protein
VACFCKHDNGSSGSIEVEELSSLVERQLASQYRLLRGVFCLSEFHSIVDLKVMD